MNINVYKEFLTLTLTKLGLGKGLKVKSIYNIQKYLYKIYGDSIDYTIVGEDTIDISIEGLPTIEFVYTIDNNIVIDFYIK